MKHFFFSLLLILGLGLGLSQLHPDQVQAVNEVDSVSANPTPTPEPNPLGNRLRQALGLNIGYSIEGTSPDTTSTTLAQSSTRLAYGGGVYTNLCGTGTAATAHTCNQGCNTATGTCISSGLNVVKYTCDGYQTECRSNESSFTGSHQLAGTACGQTVQIDVFNQNCRAGGGWNCSEDDLLDYIVWYSGDCQNNDPAPSCSAYEPVNTQFRESGTFPWYAGSEFTNLEVNNRVDVNCFAQNGTSLLPGARIVVTRPDGSTQSFNQPELRNYQLVQAGQYSVRCESTTIPNCTDTDRISVQSTAATPTPVASPAPSPTPEPHTSSCDDLDVVGGNNSLVPAKVTLRARGSDSGSGIQEYKFYFGDGDRVETDDPEVQHTYESSGTFTARVDVKDSQGNWKTSDACEARVTVKPSSIESHKSECSDVFISTDNGAMAPATVTFDINGYDNKGDIQAYRVKTGTGRTLEETDDKLEYLYQEAGTYTIQAYIKDSQGDWVGGDDGCERTLYITTEPLTTQPDTGTPTWFTLGGLLTGGAGLSLQLAKRKLFDLA